MAATERPRHCKRSYSCCHSPVRREITPGDRFGASFPKIAASASWSEGMTASGPKECPNAHRDAAQIEHGQQGIEAARTPRPFRQDRRGEADLLLGRPIRGAVAHLRALYVERTDPGQRGLSTFRLTKCDDVCSLLHGVSFLLEVLAGSHTRHDTPPSQTPSPISPHSLTGSVIEYVIRIP
jgi:hypothetical protein